MPELVFKLIKRKSIVRQLNEKLGGSWTAVRNGFGWRWKCADGREIRAYSQLTPQHDADDETCTTVYIDSNGYQVGCAGLIW